MIAFQPGGSAAIGAAIGKDGRRRHEPEAGDIVVDALAVLEVIAEEKLCERSVQIGHLLVDALRDAARTLPTIGEVRGLGAMVAIELVKNGDARQPDADLAKALVKRAAEKGLVLLSCGLYGNVIRFLVPLTASDEIIREGLAIVKDAMHELTSNFALASVVNT